MSLHTSRSKLLGGLQAISLVSKETHTIGFELSGLKQDFVTFSAEWRQDFDKVSSGLRDLREFQQTEEQCKADNELEEQQIAREQQTRLEAVERERAEATKALQAVIAAMRESKERQARLQDSLSSALEANRQWEKENKMLKLRLNPK